MLVSLTCLNPFSFRAGVLLTSGAEHALATARLNPFSFRAGVLLATIGKYTDKQGVSIPFHSGLGYY